MTNNFKAFVEYEKHIPKTGKTVTIRKEFDNVDDYNRFIEKLNNNSLENNLMNNLTDLITNFKEEIGNTANDVAPEIKKGIDNFGRVIKDKVINPVNKVINNIEKESIEKEIINIRDKINKYKEQLKEEIRKASSGFDIEELKKALDELYNLRDSFDYLGDHKKVKEIKEEIIKLKNKLDRLLN